MSLFRHHHGSPDGLAVRFHLFSRSRWRTSPAAPDPFPRRRTPRRPPALKKRSTRHVPTASAEAGAASGFSPVVINIMANTIKQNQRRRPGRKAEDIRRVWKEQAPEAEFAGITLIELETSLVDLQQANEDLKIKDQARSAAVKMRDEKLADLTTLLRTVVRGVQGHKKYGEDSPLYRAMGFVPVSERSSGLKRSKNGDTGNTVKNKTAA